MTSIVPTVKKCPKCDETIPCTVDRRTTQDKVPRMIVGGVIALGSLAGILFGKLGEATGLTLIALSFGIAFTHSFTAAVRAWRNGKKR